MTPTKRKRLHVESNQALPGDLVTFKRRTALKVGPRLTDKSHCWLDGMNGLVIALDKWLNYVLVIVQMPERLLLGWVFLRDVKLCR